MRTVNAEFKDPQVGLWETLNTNCPSGAAADLLDVDFPVTGGVKQRSGLVNLFPAKLFSGPPEPVPFVRDPRQGFHVIREGIGSARFAGPLEAPPQRLGQVHPPAIQMLPFVGDVLVLHKRALEVTVTERQPSNVAYVMLGGVTDNTTYTIEVTLNGQKRTASYTIPARETQQPKLDISHIALQSGAITQTQGVFIIPGGEPTWEPDPQFPDELMTTRKLPFQDRIVDFIQSSPKGAGSADPHLRRVFSAQGQRDGVTDGGKLKTNEIAGLPKGFPGDEDWPSWRPVVPKEDTNLWHHAHEFDYKYTEQPVNPAFNAEVQQAQVRYQKELAEFSARWAEQTSQHYVLGKLVEALYRDAPGATYLIVPGSSSLSIQADGLSNVVVSDTRTGTALRSTYKSVDDVASLPAQALQGTLVVVRDVMFEFNNGTWEEVAGYTLSTNQQGPTLLNDDTELLLPASERRGTFAEMKDLAGSHVPVYAGWWASRFIFVTSRGVWVSAVGSPLEVWPTSSVNPREDDGYFLPVGTGSDPVTSAHLFESGLVVVTQERVFLIRLGSRNTVVIQQTGITGSLGAEVKMVSTVLGTFMTRQEADGRLFCYLLTPSSEGGRLRAIPYLQQLDTSRRRDRLKFLTSNARGTELYLCFEDFGMRVWLGEVPRITKYSTVCGHWAGFVGEEMVVYRQVAGLWGIYHVKEGVMKDEGQDKELRGSITFHPPPQWRSYAPDGRYTLKQAACWPEEGDTIVSCRNLSRKFSRLYPVMMPLHQPGEHQVTFSSASDQWHVKAFQYTLVVRNGKTPGAWA